MSKTSKPRRIGYLSIRKPTSTDGRYAFNWSIGYDEENEGRDEEEE